MLILLPLGLLAVFAALWILRRNSTLTRQCRWREVPGDRTDEGTLWHCVACGAQARVTVAPRHCLRPKE